MIGKMLSTAQPTTFGSRLSPDTSERQLQHLKPVGQFANNRIECRAARTSDATCRDLVNEPKQPATSQEGTSSIVFLGANDKEMPVEGRKDTYILDAGLDGGLELPYTCRGGICGACVGRVVEGTVDMSDISDLSFTLDADEQAMGLALLCMARPVSDVVRIETQSDWGYSLGSGSWNGATGEIGGKKVQPLNPWGSDS